MKKKLAFVLALAMILAMFAGCGSNNANDTADKGGNTATSEKTENKKEETKTEEKKEEAAPSRDTVNLSINQAWTTADPHATSAIQDSIIKNQVYNGLMFYNEITGEVEFELAESYEVNEEGTVYTFTLRDDIYFHNGDKVLASDAAFSIMRAADPARPVASAATNIVSAEALDDRTVQITLAIAYQPFIINAGRIAILSEREVTEMGDKFGVELSGAGAGPYKITYLDHDQQITLEAYDKYHRGEPSIKYVNFYPITDSAAAMISFESGDLDWYNCSVTDFTRLEAEGKYNTESARTHHLTFAVINPYSTNPALQNELVRKAIAYAINKEEMNYAAFDGAAEEADYLMNPDLVVAAPEHDVVYNYNPEKAKELLAEAGYPDGVDCGKIMCFTGSHFEVCATVMQAQLEAVGIKTELEWIDQSITFERGRNGEYDIMMTGGNGNGDYDSLRIRFYSPQNGGYVKYQKTEYDYEWLDMMIDKGASTTDPDERLAVHKELDEYLMNTATYLPLLHKAVPFVWNKDLVIEQNCAEFPVIRNWSWS